MIVARWAGVGALAWAAAVGTPVAGAAPQDPPPPPPAPAPAPEPEGLLGQLAGIGTVMGQTGSPAAGPFGLPDLSALGPTLLLAQNAAPTPAGIAAPGQIPNLNAFNPDYLVPLNSEPAPPGEGEPAPGLGPSTDSPGTGRLAFLRRIYEMYSAGQLRGALLGQNEPGQAPQAPQAPEATQAPGS